MADPKDADAEKKPEAEKKAPEGVKAEPVKDEVAAGEAKATDVTEASEATLVVPADHAPELAESHRAWTEEDKRALEEHVNLRVSELVTFCRQEAAKYDEDPRPLATLIARRLGAAFDPDED